MKKKTILSIGLLLIVVIILVVSRKSLISSTTSIYKSNDIFQVTFSTKENKLELGSISATTTPKSFTTTSANISTTTISGMNVEFSEPGQKAIYNVFAYNNGNMDAYLKSITSGKIVCTPGDGSSPILVNNACNDITLKVVVKDKTSISTKDIDGSIPKVTNHFLKSKTGEKVQIIVEYKDHTSKVDGTFTVLLPTISLSYYSIDE